MKEYNINATGVTISIMSWGSLWVGINFLYLHNEIYQKNYQTPEEINKFLYKIKLTTFLSFFGGGFLGLGIYSISPNTFRSLWMYGKE